ncbi:MAG TPA: DUF2231 domain-containing protein, partial [Phycisphaerales bacterium]|nr:DUF2231 domain-containing protein [Phycisphaerales bacterium]
MDIFYDMYDSLNNPPMRHAMFVHMPIVLSILGFFFVVLAALRPKSKGQRALAIFLYALLIVAAYFTADAGDGAENAINGKLSAEAVAVLDEHESMGQQVWVFGASVLTLLVISSLPNKMLRVGGHVFSIILSGYTLLWVSETAHYGGMLVYTYGVGPAKQPERGPKVDLEVPINPSPATPAGTTMPTSSPAASMSEEEARVAFFRTQVRPILEENCLRCHNPVRHKGDL